MRIVGWIAVIVMMIVVLSGISLIGSSCEYAGRMVNQVASPERVVGQYEWFIQQDADIKKMDPQIAEAQRAVTQFEADAGARDKWTFQDRDEHSRLTSVVTGLRQERQDMVAAYNAKSDQKTRSFLKSHNLPDHYE